MSSPPGNLAFMRRTWVILFALTLLTAACSSDDGDSAGETTTTTVADVTTSAAAETTAAPDATTPETTTTAAATTSVAAASTTTTTVAASAGSLALTRIVFEPAAYALITNVGGSDAELGGLWLCRRPSYEELPAMTLAPGDTLLVGLGDTPPPELAGLAGTVDLGPVLGPITGADGELGLYTGPTFGDPNAIVDYVQWGTAGHGRESVAVDAGIWAEGTFVEVPVEAVSISSAGTPGIGVDAWFADVGG